MLGNWDGRHFGESEWFGRCVIYYRSTCETCFFPFKYFAQYCILLFNFASTNVLGRTCGVVCAARTRGAGEKPQVKVTRDLFSFWGG